MWSGEFKVGSSWQRARTEQTCNVNNINNSRIVIAISGKYLLRSFISYKKCCYYIKLKITILKNICKNLISICFRKSRKKQSPHQLDSKIKEAIEIKYSTNTKWVFQKFSSIWLFLGHFSKIKLFLRPLLEILTF